MSISGITPDGLHDCTGDGDIFYRAAAALAAAEKRKPRSANSGAAGDASEAGGFRLSAILGKPSPAKAAALSNLHRAKRSPLSRAFVLWRLSDARPYTGSIARAGPAS